MRSFATLVLAAVGCAQPAPAPTPEAPPPAAPHVTPGPVAITDQPTAEELAVPNRPLTDGEIALLQPLFRDGIDYERVRVIDNSFPLQPENVYMTPRGHIYAPGTLFRPDFATASPSLRAVFVHEMTHVWQFTNGMDLVGQGAATMIKYRGNYERAYPYELTANRDLVEYGMEQQASIIEDYFDITAQHGSARRMTNRGVTSQQRDTLFASVLARFLADAKYARGLDPAQIAAQHAKDAQTAQPGPEACAESEAEHGAAHMCGWRYIETSH